jgi:hypothetical protein
MKLTRRQLGLVRSSLDDLFYRIKVRLLGKYFTGPAMYFEVTRPDPMDSLESVYRFTGMTLYGPDFAIDEDHLKTLAEITGNYIEAQRLKATNEIVVGIKSASTPEDAHKIIDEVIEKTTNYMSMLTTTEGRIVQAFAERDGITRLASDMGIEDPIVAFLGRYDEKTCKYCLAMYHMPNNPMVPRVYKMSELQSGYFKSKTWDKKTIYFAPLHPHCRHVMTFVPPNFGFGADGVITFKGLGHDEWASQRETQKSEAVVTDFSNFGSCSCHPQDSHESLP